MDLEETILHLRDLIGNHDFECEGCRRDHEELLAFLEELKRRRARMDGDYQATRSAICNLPSVDAVSVIRCEKCAESCCVNDILFCAYWGKETREDG